MERICRSWMMYMQSSSCPLELDLNTIITYTMHTVFGSLFKYKKDTHIELTREGVVTFAYSDHVTALVISHLVILNQDLTYTLTGHVHRLNQAPLAPYSFLFDRNQQEVLKFPDTKEQIHTLRTIKLYYDQLSLQPRSQIFNNRERIFISLNNRWIGYEANAVK